MERRCGSMRIFAAITLALIVSSQGMAQTPEQTERAQNIYKQIRCPVCTVQSVDESDAKLSENLRVKIMDQILSGETDAQILQSLAETYGDDVRLMPKTEARTLPLWLAPWSVVLLGGVGILAVRRSRNSRKALDTENT